MKKRTGSDLKNSSSERAVEGAPSDCSPAYRLAFADQDFLLRDELRSERFVFKKYKRGLDFNNSANLFDTYFLHDRDLPEIL